MKQLEFFEYNFRKEIINCQKRLSRAEKKLEWLMCIQEMAERVKMDKTVEYKETQMEMFG